MVISNMSNIEVLKDLHDRGLLKPLVMGGIVPAKVLTYTEMYYHVDAQVKTGVKKEKAVNYTADAFNVCRATIYRVIKGMR